MIETVKYEAHELAGVIPKIPADELREMQNNIKAHGLVLPIVLFEEKVLDGVHRQLACVRAGVEPRYVQFEELNFNGSPAEFVDSINLKRRHLNLTTSQRAAIGAELVDTFEKAGIFANLQKTKATEEAAKRVGTSPRSVAAARKVKKEAPQKFNQIKAGKMSVSEAASKLPVKKPKPDKQPSTRTKKEKTVGERVWHDYKLLLGHYKHNELREVKKWLREYLSGKEWGGGAK